MKVTENSTYRLMQTNMDRITNRLQVLREQGATGIKLNRPSDDPASIRPVLNTRTQITETERYLESMEVSLDKMQATDGHLEHVENILQRVKEIGINAINGSLSPENLDVLAEEVNFLRQELLDAANGVVDGKYIFAGYQENTKPFVLNPNYDPDNHDYADSTTWPVYYEGDGYPMELEITPGERIEVNLTGNELFLGINNTSYQLNGPSDSFPYTSDPNRTDLFSVLTRMEEAIRAGNIDDTLGAGDGIQANLDLLDVAQDQNRRLRSQLGNRATRTETAISHQQNVLIDLEQILSRYQDADVIETFNDIISQETAFEAALNITSKVKDVSILDFF